MKEVLIVISTCGIGGAEKRFIELWLAMKKSNIKNIRLALPKTTFDEVVKIKQFHIMNNYLNDIVLYEIDNNLSYWKKRNLLINLINQFDIYNTQFHFIMTSPILINLFNKHKIIYTFTATSFKQMNVKGVLTTLISIFEANKIDVLDPNITSLIKKLFFWKKKLVLNTPGSFVDTNYYAPDSFKNKKNWLVFLGRFEPEKQVVEFVHSIPFIVQKMQEMGIIEYQFFILGKGTLKKQLNYYLNSEEMKDIHVSLYFEEEPISILKYSKIFFSLQKYSNYPSKSLLEAISCGNLPIVTDNRNTRLIAKDSFSYYVEENFTKEMLAQQCTDILSLKEDEFYNKAQQGSKFVQEGFSVDNSINYFMKMYTR